MITPRVLVFPLRNERAVWFGRYPNSLAAANTRSRVAWDDQQLAFRLRISLADETLTPANLATCVKVGRTISAFFVGVCRFREPVIFSSTCMSPSDFFLDQEKILSITKEFGHVYISEFYRLWSIWWHFLPWPWLR